MIEFQQKYIEDASELIQQLEERLVGFEDHPSEEATVQELFRVMHTLKGTSAMFGFTKIESLAHVLEDLFDQARKGRRSIGPESIDLTLASVDMLKLLLQTRERLSPEQEARYHELARQARLLAGTDDPPGVTLNPAIFDIVAIEKSQLHRVVFRPNPNVLLRGISPEAVVLEILELGASFSQRFTADSSLPEDDPDHFNAFWEIFLEGKVGREQIEDVFIFFDEEEFLVESLARGSALLQTSWFEQGLPLEELEQKLESLWPAEQEHQAPPPAVEPAPEARPAEEFDAPAEETIRVQAKKLDNLINAVSQLIILHAQLENQARQIENESLSKTVKAVSKLARHFRDEVLTTRLVPISALMTTLRRLVRDLSAKLGKKVEFIAEGTHTELDKNIIAKIEGPLVHIIRNSIDHGIEPPDERLAEHKKAEGVVRFTAFHSGSSVFLQVQDDGRGIDPAKILEKARQRGLVAPEAKLAPRQVFDLLFMPGFSTAAEVSEISGRGVGLDVVKKAVLELRGEINIDSEVGLGTVFTVKMPLTLSILDALLVDCHRHKILIPTSNVLFCRHLPADHFTEGEFQYKVNGRFAPVLRLADHLGIPRRKTGFEVLVVINIFEKYYGILVDRIDDTVQAVVKPLDAEHERHRLFLGVSELGDGSLAFILDTNFLLNVS